MASTAPILESMSTRKLCYVVGGLSLVWAGCLLAGAVVSPKPNSSMQVSGTKCVDRTPGAAGDRWFYPRGRGKCQSIPDFDSQETLDMGLTADNIVFAFHLPHKREKAQLEYRSVSGTTLLRWLVFFFYL